MSYGAKVYEKVKSEYEQLKMTEIRKRNHRLAQIYKTIPQISEIDNEISAMGNQMVQLILSEPNRAKEFTEMAKQKLAELKEARINLLVRYGYPKDYTDVHYSCPVCEDTGFVNGSECECFKKKLRIQAYKESNLYELIKNQSFEKFNPFLFSEKINKNGMTQRAVAKENLEFCKNYAKNFDNEERGLLLYGGAGLGKTFLSTCIAKQVIDSGKNVIYQSAVSMFSYYLDYIFGRTPPEQARADFEKFKKCDLFIIDDLGAEATNPQMSAFLFELLNDRALAGKKTIISTNYSLNEIASTYSERIHSRIMQYFHLIHFEGDDLRQREYV